MATGAAPAPAHQSRYPLALFYACIAFLAGVYGASLGLPEWVAILALPGALFAAWRGNWRLGVVLLTCGIALAVGAGRYTATAYHDGPGQIAHYTGHAVTLTGVVDGEPQLSGQGENLPVAVETSLIEGSPKSATGRILVHYIGPQSIEYGDRVQVQGRLDRPYSALGFDYPAYLAGQGIHATMGFPVLRVLQRGVGNPLQGLALRLRDALRRAINAMLPHEEAALLIGILLGAPTHSLGRLTDPFVRVGMIHIVAISGLKVALVAGIITALCDRLPMTIRWAPALIGVATYTLISGATAAGLRSALMWGLAVIALALGRRSYVWVSLALVAAVMVWWRSLLLWDTGFQLSVVGTAGIVLFTPWLERLLRRLPALLRESVAVTLAAQIATLPIVAVGFGQISLVSPLSNGLLLPLLGPIMVLGGLAALVTLIAPPLGHLLAFAVYPLLVLFIGVVQLLAVLPFASVPWTVVPRVFIPGYYTSLAASARRLYRSTDSTHASTTGPLAVFGALPVPLLIGLATCGAALAVALSQSPDRPVLRLAGAGGSQVALLQMPGGGAVLIDGGGNAAAVQALLGAHLPFWSREISAVLVSEPDSQHLGGLAGLETLYQIHASFDPGAIYPSIAYARWRAALRDAAVPEHKVRTGQRLDLGHGVHIDVLEPAALYVNDPATPVAYRITLGALTVLVLNREALTWDTPPLQADGACIDVLVLPTHADPKLAATMIRALHPYLVVLPQPIKQNTIRPADLAPLPRVTQLWQTAEGQELVLDSTRQEC